MVLDPLKNCKIFCKKPVFPATRSSEFRKHPEKVHVLQQKPPKSNDLSGFCGAAIQI
jgi:hypothetical protein